MVLIPFPKKLNPRPGVFRIARTTVILLDTSCDSADFEAVRSLRQEIEKRTGLRPAITKGPTGLRDLPGPMTDLIVVTKERPAAADAAQREAYRLTVDEGMIYLKGYSGAGLFYGLQTLKQLVWSCPSGIQCVEIEDAPDFPCRGFFHDVTRGKIPTLDTLKELADRLSFYKINQLQLYIEHSFAFRRHSEIWADSDPITAEEILILDEYCKRRGIELVPSIAVFGHLYHALVSKSFRHLNEYEQIPGTPFMWTERMGHYTLNVSNPESARFVFEMIDEFLPLFSSDQFNIGCDETFDLGKGRNKALAEEVGTGKLYMYFTNQIIRHVKAKNKKVMMWGDVLLRHPEVIGEVPADVVLLNWDYGAEPSEDGVRLIAETGLRQYVCPGVQGWNKLMNRLDAATKNIGAMVSHAKKYGAQGILNTDWGDFGHINLLAGSIPGMIYGAGLSWNADDLQKPSDEEISRLEYGDGSGRLVGLLREISAQAVLDWDTVVLWYYTTTGLNTDSYGYKNYYLHLMTDTGESSIKSSYQRILSLAGELSALGGSIRPEKLQDMKELLVAADGLALFQALLLVIKKKFLGQKDTGLLFDPKEVAAKLECWFMEYKKAWRCRNRESELYRIKDVLLGICGLLRD
jgi:hypothetical protein